MEEGKGSNQGPYPTNSFRSSGPMTCFCLLVRSGTGPWSSQTPFEGGQGKIHPVRPASFHLCNHSSAPVSTLQLTPLSATCSVSPTIIMPTTPKKRRATGAPSTAKKAAKKARTQSTTKRKCTCQNPAAAVAAPPRVRLMDMPPELYQRIIHHFVLGSRNADVMRARGVSRKPHFHITGRT